MKLVCVGGGWGGEEGVSKEVVWWGERGGGVRAESREFKCVTISILFAIFQLACDR